LEAAQIWRQLAPHYFPVDCFRGSSDLAETGSTAQIWWELAPHYFPVDYFRGGSDLAGTGNTSFPGAIFRRIIFEAAHI
jgi:hypothetical protein